MNTRNNVLNIIQNLVSESDDVKNQGEGSKLYKDWRQTVDVTIREFLGESSSKYREVHSLLFCSPMSLPSENPLTFDYFRRRMDEVVSILKGCYNISIPYSANNNATDVLSRILTRFPLFVGELSEKYKSSSVVFITEEKDVQYLLNGLLELYFNSVMREEPVPSKFGSSSRIDFLLKQDRIAIEVKMIRKGLGYKEVCMQLKEDKHLYIAHPGWDILICFIYDPERKIKKVQDLKIEIEEKFDGREVKVIVAQ